MTMPQLKPTVYAFLLGLAIVVATAVIIIADKAADVPSWFQGLAYAAAGGGLVAIPTAPGPANPLPAPAAPLPPPAPAAPLAAPVQ